MTNEELIREMLLCSETHLQSGINEHTKYDEYKAELLRRLNERDELEKENNNLKESLKGIASMNNNDGVRMKLWATDSLSGFTESLEAITLKQQDEINRLREGNNDLIKIIQEKDEHLASAQRAVEAISKIKLIFGSTHLLSWKEQAEVRYVLELYYYSSCQCPACTSGVLHASDCAVHNMPAYPNGECNCGADTDGLIGKEREGK